VTARGVAGVSAVLLDIEGTITPIAFVTAVLFPHARQHLRSYLEDHAESTDLHALLSRLRQEHASDVRAGEPVPLWPEGTDAKYPAAAARYVEWLMDRDRKSPALKELQGRIWERGYERRELVGQVFPDVPQALERWRQQGIRVGIFSSGSVLAQQLLLRHSSAGDLTGLIEWYFDTTVGAKARPESYRRIIDIAGLPPPAILFVSDVVLELDAALEAGMQVRLSIRPGNPPAPAGHRDGSIVTFDELELIQ
jgi:enolase-phosphatase E1